MLFSLSRLMAEEVVLRVGRSSTGRRNDIRLIPDLISVAVVPGKTDPLTEVGAGILPDAPRSAFCETIGWGCSTVFGAENFALWRFLYKKRILRKEMARPSCSQILSGDS